MLRPLIALAVLAACAATPRSPGGASPSTSSAAGAAAASGSAPADSPPPPGATNAPAASEVGTEVDACENACTDVAACWEEVNGGDYHQGGACVAECDARSGDERLAWFRCLDAIHFPDECQAMLDC